MCESVFCIIVPDLADFAWGSMPAVFRQYFGGVHLLLQLSWGTTMDGSAGPGHHYSSSD